jgi:hypothetical protein
MAFVVRGLIYKLNNTISSTGKDVVGSSVDHDFLRSWPSMRDNLVLPARDCDINVTVFVAVHPNA